MQPVPVLVTHRNLPRVAAVVALGLALSSWLALQLDAVYTAEDQPAEDINPDFYYPYELPLVHGSMHRLATDAS